MGNPHDQPIRIFISHSSADNAFGVRLADDLRRVLGDPVAVWYDSAGGLRGGAAWWQTIVKEIGERNIFIVIWSPDAKESRWVNDEIDLAWEQKNDRGTIIIPVICQPCDLRGDLRTRQAISFTDPDAYDQRFADLLMALGVDVNAPETATPPVTPPATPAGTSRDEPDVARPVEASELLLLSIDGLWPPMHVPLHGSAVTLGRESGNDVLVADPAVSRFHLRMRRQRAGWRVEALPDTKPVYVNGERRQAALVGYGDQVVVGGTVLRIESPGARAGATTELTDLRTVLASGLVPELEVESPSFAFTSLLRADIVTIGRAPDCTIVIPSPLISSHHATLRRQPDGGYLFETAHGVRNEFLLAGRPVRKYALRDGDMLTIGSPAQHQYVAAFYRAIGQTSGGLAR